MSLADEITESLSIFYGSVDPKPGNFMESVAYGKNGSATMGNVLAR